MNILGASGRQTSRIAWVAYSAWAWAYLFTAIHIYWAFGGMAGLPPGKSVLETGGLLLAIDIIAIPMGLIGGAVMLALVQQWGQKIPHWMLFTAAWGSSVVLLLRGSAGLVQASLILIGVDKGPLDIWSLWDLWFVFGAIIFAMATWLEHHYRSRLKKTLTYAS